MGNVVITGAATPDHGGHAVLFARLPERLGDERRRQKYDEPLASMIREAGIGAFLRGLSEPNEQGGVDWIGLEAKLTRLPDCGHVLAWLLQLGAPAETLVEIDTANSAFVQFRLSEAMAR